MLGISRATAVVAYDMLICVTPSHQFPLGVTMSPERRTRLLDHACRFDAHVVEDDYDAEFRYGGRPLDALQTLAPGQVCYVGTGLS